MNLRSVVREHRLITTVVAAVLPFVAAAVLSLVRDTVSTATAVLILVAFVVAAGATGIRAAGLAATISAAAWFDFFLTAPYNSFAIAGADDLEAAILLFVIGGIVTETALWGLRQEAALSRQTGYLGGVLATAETLAAHHQTREEVTEGVAQRIVEVLDLDSCRFVPGSTVDVSAPTLEHDGSLTRDGHRISDRDGLPVDRIVVLPVRVGGQLRGHFQLTASSHVARPSAEQRRVAVLLADQVGGWLNGASHDVRGEMA